MFVAADDGAARCGRDGDASHRHRLCAPAQVVWSCEIRTALRVPATAGPKYRGDDGDSLRAFAGESTKQAGSPLRAERRMYPVLSW